MTWTKDCMRISFSIGAEAESVAELVAEVEE